jgi:hypothetical protein
MTALAYAATNGFTACVALLVSRLDVRVNLANKVNNIFQCNVQCSTHAHLTVTSPHILTHKEGDTALILAVRKGDRGSVEELCNRNDVEIELANKVIVQQRRWCEEGRGSRDL